MPLFQKRKKSAAVPTLLQTTARPLPLSTLDASLPPPPSPAEFHLYDALRFSVPVIDAAIRKIVRLTGGFRLTAPTPHAQALLDTFSDVVPVGGFGASLQSFADQMLDSLLTYGNAVGEIVLDDEGMPAGLLTAHPARIRLIPDGCRCNLALWDDHAQKARPFPHPDRILFAALDPPAGGLYGVSILRGLPAISQILLRIYDCIGQNYERAGNVRYAVTYHPDEHAAPFAKDHAREIADAWQAGIKAARYGEAQDFIAVGDVDIQVIGAENQLFDTNVPVRQLLEQIISKLSIPPFLLGFSWATTERMSTQQADILTSELESFRRILSPILRRIGDVFLHAHGFDCPVSVEWCNINLQDETALAEARLKNAQATQLEQQLLADKQNSSSV